jgi:flagellar biosynthetic protein FlhB
MHDMLLLGADAPDVVQRATIGAVILSVAKEIGLSVAPIAFACCVAGVVANVAQVRFRITPDAVKPEFKKLNPVSGFKQIFGPNALVEGAKSVTKVLIVGVIVAAGLIPAIPEMGALVGIGPQELGAQLASTVLGIAKRAAFAYLLIGVADYFWQKYKLNKSLRMDKQEIRGRGPLRPAPPRDADVAGAHDGRGPGGGRHRHQPDALLRRAEVRRRHAGADGRGQGPGPHGAEDP